MSLISNKSYVLVVDDDELALHILRQSLTKLGYDSICFDSGQKAMDFLSSLDAATFPVVIISDMMMDNGDGLDILQMTRNNPVMANIPFVFFSNANQELFSDLIEPNACKAYLKKPIDFLKVKSIFENLKSNIAS